jgi:hypothetical protein
MSEKPELEAKIVEAIYRGACEPSEFKRALELIAGYFDSSGVVLGELDAAHPKDQFVVAANGGDDQYFENYQAYAEFDPAPRAYMAQPAGKAALTDRIFSREQRQGFVFLNEFLRPPRDRWVVGKFAVFGPGSVRDGRGPARRWAQLRRRRYRSP